MQCKSASECKYKRTDSFDKFSPADSLSATKDLIGNVIAFDMDMQWKRPIFSINYCTFMKRFWCALEHAYNIWASQFKAPLWIPVPLTLAFAWRYAENIHKSTSERRKPQLGNLLFVTVGFPITITYTAPANSPARLVKCLTFKLEERE